MNEKKVWCFNTANEKLAGIETVPSTIQRKYATILLVHGFGVTKEEGGMFNELSRSLANAGFLVYRFDFSGRGESEGKYVETSLTKQISDLRSILQFVKSNPRADPFHIGILAQSFGTMVTVALRPKVKTIILMGSIAHPEKIIGNPKNWEKFNPQGISIKKKSNGETIEIGAQFWSEFSEHDLLGSITQINSPILFLHGSHDTHVPISEMESLFEKANTPKEKIVIEGADHGMRPDRKKMYEIVVRWFSENL